METYANTDRHTGKVSDTDLDFNNNIASKQVFSIPHVFTKCPVTYITILLYLLHSKVNSLEHHF